MTIQKYIIWSKNNCSFCQRAKDYLTERGVDYEERNVEGKDWTVENLWEVAPGTRTMPVIFNGDRFIGGYNSLIAHIEMGNLKL
jgi:thioredoxin reductase (NADPH)